MVIHKCLRDTVILAGMPESRHRDVKDRRHPALLSNMRESKVSAIAPASIQVDHPCRYDDSWTELCITTRAGAWEPAKSGFHISLNRTLTAFQSKDGTDHALSFSKTINWHLGEHHDRTRIMGS